jgi:hypothetical protein
MPRELALFPPIGKSRNFMKYSKRKLSVAPMMDWTEEDWFS